MSAEIPRLYERLSRQALVLIGQIEKITPQISALDEALEAEIAKQRRTVPARNGTLASAAPVVAGSVAANTTGAAAAQFCTECGTALQAGFKFCAHCGAPVTKLAPVSGV